MLCTLPLSAKKDVKERLDRNNISYMIQNIGNDKINVFFGKQECLTVANKICKNRSLNLLNPEEDFILGILLGYSIHEQCCRYCKKQ